MRLVEDLYQARLENSMPFYTRYKNYLVNFYYELQVGANTV